MSPGLSFPCNRFRSRQLHVASANLRRRRVAAHTLRPVQQSKSYGQYQGEQRISDLGHPARKVDLDHLDRARYKDQQKPELGVVYEAEDLKLHCCGVIW